MRMRNASSRHGFAALLTGAAFVFLMLPAQAFAACTSPAAVAGSLNWSGTAFQYCDGTTWQGFGGGGALSSLSDATITSPANNDLLRYNSSTSKWVNTPVASLMTTTTMVPSWPDAIICYGSTGNVTLYRSYASSGGAGYVSGYTATAATDNISVGFNSSGTMVSVANTTSWTNYYNTNCNGASGNTIAQLYSSGYAFNFVGSSGQVPGGSTTQMQYNNGGVLGGATGFTFGVGGVGISVNASPALSVSSTAGSGSSAIFANMGGTNSFSVNAMNTGTGTSYGGYFVGSNATGLYASGSIYGGSFYSTASTGISIYGEVQNAAGKPLVLKGAASQSGDLTQWLNSGGTVLTKVDAGGSLTISNGALTAISATTTATASNPVAIYGNASGASGLTYGGWFTAASTSGFGVVGIATGSTGTTYGGYFKSSSAAGIGAMAEAGTATTKVLVAKAAASQTANLQEWQNSGGTALSFVDASGNLALAASGYLNFGSTSGTSGYGFRDNAGTIQVKNSGGSWANIPTSGTSQWTTTGSNIYYTTGSVGIGTTTMAINGMVNTLTVNGVTTRGMLELATDVADAAGTVVGQVGFFGTANTSGKQTAAIVSTTEGATAANRGGTMQFYTKPNGGAIAERARFDSNGNFGIGTTSPYGVLSLSSASWKQLEMGITSTSPFAFISSDGTSLVLDTNRRTADGTFANTSATHNRILMSTGNAAGYISFSASNTNNTLAPEVMRIAGSGNVGIGTTVPGAQLHIFKSAAQATFDMEDNATGGTPTNSRWRLFVDKVGGGGGNLTFGLFDVTNGAVRFGIDNSGNVGIGTTTVNHKLDVNGNIGMAASSYINFGATDGTSGYGIRDNAGTIEIKNSSGSWAAPSGGSTPGVTYLATYTASASASLAVTSQMTASYDAYEFVLENVVPATNNQPLCLQVSTDNGSTWKTTGYTTSGATTNCVVLTTAVKSGQAGSNGTVRVSGISGSANYKVFNMTYTAIQDDGYGTSVYSSGVSGGYYNAAQTAINAVRFLFNSGNIASGKIRIYGLKTS